MTDENLADEFVRDHKDTTRALVSLQSALAGGTDDAVRSAAEQLDRIAGPHIAFEEAVLYPLVAESRGESFEQELLDEHDEVLQALREINDSPSPMSADEATRKKWLAQLRTGLDHVETCGTLLSHLTALPDERRAHLLSELLRLRAEGPRWTETAQ